PRRHAARQDHRQYLFCDPSEEGRIRQFSRSDFPGRYTERFEQLDRRKREWSREEDQPLVTSMIGESAPLLGRELHSSPVIEPGRVLARKADAELFGGRRFGGGNMGLELDSVGPG